MARREGAARVAADEALALWREYQESGDTRLRDRLVLTYAPMVKYIVYRKVREIPAHCEAEDFIACGLEALIRSIDRYDPEKGATLEQFAWTRIHGAVLDELRRHDWIPRSLRRWQRDLAKVQDQFVGVHGRSPSRDELATALGVSTRELDQRRGELARAPITSLNALVHSDDELAVERIDTITVDDPTTDPEAATLALAVRAQLRQALSCLSERERKIAVLLYVHNLTLRETGAVFGITESRICQLHAQILRALRERLQSDEEAVSVAA